MLTAARILYAKHWKHEQIPKISERINKLVFLAEMDKLTKKNWRNNKTINLKRNGTNRKTI